MGSWLRAPDGAAKGGRVTIIGFGSLMDPSSASQTMRGSNMRRGTVDGFCRVFNLVSIINIARGYAKNRELATCTAMRRENSFLRVSLMDIDKEEYEAFARREARLRHEVVEYVSDDGDRGVGVICTAYSDEEYRKERVRDDDDYFEQVGKLYDGKLYRNDLLPVPNYLRMVVRAHMRHGDDFLDNFLDHSFLGDGTRMRDYAACMEIVSSLKSELEAC
ncbi:hypothetical protein GUITHDRAFT_137296 [Guillardia theta CCMP2712]|uniref:Gamma-glutamylcyclotransferase AIG2-like domain-containing protein n=2 Tax=Guillardia theta TaxID=55529 RepID=L1JH86_GUITC|nr:hypothetical protein GUITHDRAFT_137296 [Guillardia theta CCMP2712]EKX47504.1 hypothetical protein GUITHDRAFT_137296 [Guillardia theta CCMP2712]|eukprot:XP_005834484.1 hypothetical protein GUITHDRAFT_137296 [Guillardia theta CCMP2712]